MYLTLAGIDSMDNGKYVSTLIWHCAIATLGAALCLPQVAAQSPSPVPDEITFSTPWQARVFRIRSGVFTTRKLQDKYPITEALVLPRLQKIRNMDISSAEFGIHLHDGPILTAYNFAYQGSTTEQLGQGGRTLIVQLAGRTVPLNVTLTYTYRATEPWIRKELRIVPRTEAARNMVVDQIDVERIGYTEGEVDGGGIGQPVFLSTRNYFFGLEYPEGHNDRAAGVIRLTHYPGRKIGDGMTSKSAVWGVAPDGQARLAFIEQYVPSIALHSRLTPYITFRDPWNSGSSPNQAIVQQSIAILKKELVDKGVKVDAYGIDGPGWYDPASILELNRSRFPDGLEPLVNAAEGGGMKLGLWVSLTGSDMNTFWGLARGLEAVKGDEVSGSYCIAGSRYRAALKAALARYLDVYRVSNFKFDYNSFSCRDGGHGHPTEALAAKEAAVDGYIDVLRFIHLRRPSATMELTSGMWLSPWWLQYADWVWLGGSDLDFLTPSGKPSLETPQPTPPPGEVRRPEEISYRDLVLWDDFRGARYSFPASALVQHGFYNWLLIGGAPDPEAGIEGQPSCCDEPLQDFTDHVAMVLMRGSSDWELLLNLPQMTTEKWEYLRRGLRWGKEHWDTLSHTRMILGNPAQGQVYGYMHFANGRGILAVRNPANHSQTAEVALNAENGVWDAPAQPLPVRRVYPCEEQLPRRYGAGDAIQTVLKGRQMSVFEIGDFHGDSQSLSMVECSASR